MLELKETVNCSPVMVLLFIVLLGDQFVSTPTHMNTQKFLGDHSLEYIDHSMLAGKVFDSSKISNCREELNCW